MRRFWITPVVASAALAVAVAGAVAHGDDGDGALKDERHFRAQALKEYEGGNKGRVGLGTWSPSATPIWTPAASTRTSGQHEGYAYVGQWGFADWATGNSRFCATDDKRGVAVIDARDPSSPERVATLLNPAGTSAEDVVVYTARYGAWAGRDIAVAGIQYCGGSRTTLPANRGLMLWDVTDPRRRSRSGISRTACCTRGVHEFEVQHRSDLGRTYRVCHRANVPLPGQRHAKRLSRCER